MVLAVVGSGINMGEWQTKLTTVFVIHSVGCSPLSYTYRSVTSFNPSNYDSDSCSFGIENTDIYAPLVVVAITKNSPVSVLVA